MMGTKGYPRKKSSTGRVDDDRYGGAKQHDKPHPVHHAFIVIIIFTRHHIHQTQPTTSKCYLRLSSSFATVGQREIMTEPTRTALNWVNPFAIWICIFVDWESVWICASIGTSGYRYQLSQHIWKASLFGMGL